MKVFYEEPFKRILKGQKAGTGQGPGGDRAGTGQGPGRDPLVFLPLGLFSLCSQRPGALLLGICQSRGSYGEVGLLETL